METLLLQMLAVQNQILATHQEILAEVRLLRRAVEQGAPAPAMDVAPQAAQAVAAAPAPLPEPVVAVPEPVTAEAPRAPEPAFTPPPPPEPEPEPEPAPVSRRRGMLTLDELADLGGQFLDPDARPRSRVKSVDAGDLGGSLMDDLKAKNRAKRDAFAEFERLRRDR